MSVDGGTICNSNVLIHAGQVEMEQECRGKVPGCYQVGRWNGCGMLWDLNKLFRGKRLIVLCTSKTRYRIDRRSVWRIWVLGDGSRCHSEAFKLGQGSCAGKEPCAVGNVWCWRENRNPGAGKGKLRKGRKAFCGRGEEISGADGGNHWCSVGQPVMLEGKVWC